jgi:hypothetical protein
VLTFLPAGCDGLLERLAVDARKLPLAGDQGGLQCYEKLGLNALQLVLAFPCPTPGNIYVTLSSKPFTIYRCFEVYL